MSLVIRAATGSDQDAFQLPKGGMSDALVMYRRL